MDAKPEDERTPTSTGDYHGCVSMYASQAVTWENAIADVLKKAGEAYARGRDEEAEVLRDLAREWKNLPKKARQQQDDYEKRYRPSDE
jgi:hypothetical protein